MRETVDQSLFNYGSLLFKKNLIITMGKDELNNKALSIRIFPDGKSESFLNRSLIYTARAREIYDMRYKKSNMQHPPLVIPPKPLKQIRIILKERNVYYIYIFTYFLGLVDLRHYSGPRAHFAQVTGKVQITR